MYFNSVQFNLKKNILMNVFIYAIFGYWTAPFILRFKSFSKV